MRLLFKQRVFSWFDSYDIYDEYGNTVFTVKGQLSWGHTLNIYDALDNHIGTVKEVVFTFMPKFEIYEGENYIGCIKKEFSFFKPSFSIDCNGWQIDGDWLEWDYSIRDDSRLVANVSKELFNWSDTYTIDVYDSNDAVRALMVVLAIDAEKCSRN